MASKIIIPHCKHWTTKHAVYFIAVKTFPTDKLLKHLKIKVCIKSTITLIIVLKQKVYTCSLMFAICNFKRVSTKQVQCWKQPICDFHMLKMFLQDAHMRPLWTGVHQETELNSPCGDCSRNKDVVLMLRYWVCRQYPVQ